MKTYIESTNLLRDVRGGMERKSEMGPKIGRQHVCISPIFFSNNTGEVEQFIDRGLVSEVQDVSGDLQHWGK